MDVSVGVDVDGGKVGSLGVGALDGFDYELEKEDELCLPRVLGDLGQTLSSAELDIQSTSEYEVVNVLNSPLSGQELDNVVRQPSLCSRDLHHGDQVSIDQQPSVSCVEQSPGSQQMEEGSSNQHQGVLRAKDELSIHKGSPNVDNLKASSPIVDQHHLDCFDHLCHPPSPENQFVIVNPLDGHSSAGQESEDEVTQSCLISRDMPASSLSSEQPSTPCAAQSLGSQQKEDGASSVDSNSQHMNMTLSHSQDCQNTDQPSFPPEKKSENINSSSSVHRESQYVRKRPTLELQVSRQVNKPTSPLRFFQSADQPPSPYQVLQHLSGEAVRVAGKAIHSVYSTNPSPNGLGHMRSHSEVMNGYHRRSNSFQRLKSHMQKALRWGSNLREEGSSPSFNPEILANQKRQWYQLHSRALDYKKFQEPNSLFEHFIITGLHSDANLEAVEEAFVKRKKWELEMARTEVLDFKTVQTPGPTVPNLEPQILFKYPLGQKLGLRLKDLSAFCFPDGVKARIFEKTPSLSDLNELVYGQSADNATMYGVCLHVPEIVQRPPGALNASSPMSQSLRRLSRYLVSAPRCYCVLTRVPFFELHRVVGRRHPVHKCNEQQREAADQFLAVMRCYLESLCEDLTSYTITNVQANNDRVSILLKDSFIESFSGKDQPFIQLFVDTQLFSVLSDFRLSTFEHE